MSRRLSRVGSLLHGRAATIAYNAGGVWKERQLSQAIERLAARGLMRAGLTLHGLRHARGVELAMAGMEGCKRPSSK